MKRNNIIKLVFLVAYIAFIAISFWLGYNPGKEIAGNFTDLQLMIDIQKQVLESSNKPCRIYNFLDDIVH